MGTKGVMDLVAEAKEQLENLGPAEVAAEIQGDGIVLIDLRERDELEGQGTIPGAIHAPRGMVEFYADVSTPYHRDEFKPDARLVLFCASGGRSALAAKTLKDLGFENVAHLDGGFKGWVAAGNPVAEVAS